MGVIPSWVCRFFYTRRSVVSYVDNFRLGSADFFLCGSHSVLGLPIFLMGVIQKSVESYVRDFRLGCADFFLWESFRLGSADFFIRGGQ